MFKDNKNFNKSFTCTDDTDIDEFCFDFDIV